MELCDVDYRRLARQQRPSSQLESLFGGRGSLFDDFFGGDFFGESPRGSAGKFTDERSGAGDGGTPIPVRSGRQQVSPVVGRGAQEGLVNTPRNTPSLDQYSRDLTKLARNSYKENSDFMECSYGTFQRWLRLPFRVAPQQVRASFNNAVLTVTLPKTEQQERSRRIPVQGRSSGGQASQGARGALGGTVSGGAHSSAPLSARSGERQADHT
jgi:hypothetical protein